VKYLSAVFLCVSMAAQVTPTRRPQPAADTPPPVIKPEDKCAIEGTVVSAATGEPLKKARVSLRSIGQQNGGAYGATTDGAGHFLIDEVDPGRYTFSASRNLYVSQQYSPQGASRGTTLTLEKGQKLKQIVFKLTPQGVVSGRILDEDGEPFANVSIQCMTYGYARGKRQLMGQEETATNDLGEFRFHGLRPGKYVLSATYRSPEMFMGMQDRTVASTQAGQAIEEGYAVTYFPGTTTPDSAQQLDVTAGAQISGLTMTLARVRTVRVKGHLNIEVAAGRGPRRNVSVMLMPRDNQGFMMPRAMARAIDAQGNFQMRGVAPGSYTIRADFMDNGVRYSARMPLEVGNANVEGIELNLQPPLEVQGHLKIEENGDLKGANINIMLRPKMSGPMMGGGGGTQLKDDMSFKIGNLSADPYEVNVGGLPEGFYLKSVRLGQQDITETGADFSQGGAAGEMTIVINPNGGQIEGSVQNAKGDAAIGATVTLIPDASHLSLTWLYKTASTDQNGRFSVKGVRPGEYKIYAWEEVEQGAYMDPDFVKPHESAGEKVSVKDSGQATVQLKAIPAENSGNEKAIK
jgi:Carboxypeptidase regulatory-like domain